MKQKKKKGAAARTTEVEITDISNLGYGIARDGGKVLFVQHGVDGDIAKVKVIKECASYDVARIEELVRPSTYREPHPCPVSRRCGGCTYVGITREHELELKRGTVESAMRRAGLDLSVAEVLAARDRRGYRNKLQLPVSLSDGKAVMGYYAPRSHEIIPCTDCLLQHPAMSGIAEWMREQIERLGISEARHLYMRCGVSGAGVQSLAVCLVVRSRPAAAKQLGDALRGRFPQVSGFLLNYNSADTNVILGDRYELICGSEYVTDCLCGVDFRISPASFYQVNHDGAELAYRKISELADLRAGDRVLDLYCGIGTIGLSVTAGLSDVSLTGIEIVHAAVENARFNAGNAGFVLSDEMHSGAAQSDDGSNRSSATDDSAATANDIPNGNADGCSAPAQPRGNGRLARYICGDAGDAEPGQYDVIIVDPPRAGCSPSLIDRLAELAVSARSLVYMSCNPQTLARDLAMLKERGITVCGELIPIDMFPGTGHVECIAKLTGEKL